MKGLKKKLSVAAIALVAVAAVAGTSVTADAASKKPTKITLKATSKNVDIKGKVTVSVKSVKPSKASKSVTWKSSNKKIATVSSKGVVVGKKAGTVKVTATSKANKKVKATITVKVKNLKPSKVSLSSKTASLEVGKSKTLKATVKPVGVYNKGITWKSSNTKVATVKNGKVTAVAAGKATISATTKEGNKTAKCIVTVTEKAAEVTPTPTPTPEVTYNYISAADLKADIEKEDSVYTILDVRKVDDYKKAHVVTSISADCDPAVSGTDDATATANLKAAIGDGKGKYALVCYSGNAYAKKATELLIKLGVDNANIVTVTGGFGGRGATDPNASWKDTQYVVFEEDGFTKITADGLKADLNSANKVYKILDVRTESDYNAAHIKGAVSADVDSAVSQSDDGPATANLKAAIAGDKNAKYVIVCYSGSRYAQAATRILKGLGISEKNLITLKDGFGGRNGGTVQDNWKDTGYVGQ